LIAARILLGNEPRRFKAMLWTLLAILLVLWLLGVLTSVTAGGLIHLLLLIAVVVLVFNLLSGRSTV
jgi:hypothetical protein